MAMLRSDAVEDGMEARLEQYFDRMGLVLGNKQRRASFATYAVGLLSDAERKSMEPLAARACAEPSQMDAQHQRLGHFIKDATWSDERVRAEAARYALELMTAREPVISWILDDTGFLKQGKHSVGVQRQYTGSAGKIANCQIGVSLSVGTRADHLPIDFELYLPEKWIEDGALRAETRIPASMTFKTKPELALQMLARALKNDVPRGVVLADEGYGNSKEFRQGIRELGLDYAVAVSSTTKVWLVDRSGKIWSPRVGVKELALRLGDKGFRQTTWRQGTRGTLHARFAMRRVVVGSGKGPAPKHAEPQWLLMEWRDDEPEPMHFHLLTLPEDSTRKQMVRLVKERYRTERAYQDLKGELGLDHFEGRSFPGWHHHVSVVLCSYAFVLAEKLRTFFSTLGRQRGTRAYGGTARAPLRGLLHHHEAGDCAQGQPMAAEMPPLPLISSSNNRSEPTDQNMTQ